jgi:hypothetical protein
LLVVSSLQGFQAKTLYPFLLYFMRFLCSATPTLVMIILIRTMVKSINHEALKYAKSRLWIIEISWPSISKWIKTCLVTQCYRMGSVVLVAVFRRGRMWSLEHKHLR